MAATKSIGKSTSVWDSVVGAFMAALRDLRATLGTACGFLWIDYHELWYNYSVFAQVMSLNR